MNVTSILIDKELHLRMKLKCIERGVKIKNYVSDLIKSDLDKVEDFDFDDDSSTGVI